MDSANYLICRFLPYVYICQGRNYPTTYEMNVSLERCFSLHSGEAASETFAPFKLIPPALNFTRPTHFSVNAYEKLKEKLRRP